jgi:phosphoserine phosphatase
VSKCSEIAAYCDLRGITPEEVLAVGDGLNDVAMLRRAGVAVGVRGKADEAMAISECLIDPPDANGWRLIVDLVRSLNEPREA